MSDTSRHAEILAFWFGDLPNPGYYPADKEPQWWTKDEAFDETIRSRFGADVEAALAGEREAWTESADGRMAYVLLLDQFTRNIFRGSGRMFAGDERARALVAKTRAAKQDRDMPRIHRVFLYMPLMHSESLADQDLAVRLFKDLVDEAPEDLRDAYTNNHSFAVKHRDIVARFGRFPHRNALLGRDSTPEEAAFLQQPGSSF